MKIGVLTSSRADYGIYKQLLFKLSKDDRFELTIIAFGMHLLKEHGKTIEAIEKDKFGIIHTIVGKVSFSKENLYGNSKELLDTIMKLKPASAKGEYVKSIFLSSTMSPSINVDASSF